MNLDKKKKILVGGVVFILLFGGMLLLSRRDNSNGQKEETNSLPTEAVIPTISDDVKIDLVSSSAGREVALQIKNIPPGTQMIDYELSYQTAQQGLQGVIGTIELKGESDIDKNLTLGTCSSGTCIYHQVVGKVRLNLRFSGEYGEKVFEEEYEL